MISARKLRALIGALPFPYWIRCYRDPREIACAPVWSFASHKRCQMLRDRLTELGYRTEMNGQPGTSGEFIIQVVEPQEAQVA